MKILRLTEVIATTGLSRAMIYELIKDQRFPKQVQLTGRCVGWVEEEVQDWIMQRVTERDEA